MINKVSRKELTIYVILFLLTAIATYNKITHGIESDEEAAILNLYRTSLNYKSSFFSLNWEPYQLITAPFFWVIYFFKPLGYKYFVLGQRIIAGIIHLFFSIYIYLFSKKYIKLNTFTAYVVAIVCFLTTPKVGFSLDHSQPIMWFYTIFLIELYKYFANNKYKHLYFSGLSYSLAVLAHPGNILILIPVFFFLIFKKNIKTFLGFIFPCLCAFAVFFVVFLANNHLLFEDLFFFIKEYMSDGSHQLSFYQKIDIRVVIIALAFVAIAYIVKIVLSKLPTKYNFKVVDYGSILYFGYVLTSILYNLLIKNAICLFSEKYLVLTVWILIYLVKQKRKEKWLEIGILAMYITYMIFTNTQLNSNCYYLFPVTMICYGIYFEKHRDIITNLGVLLTIISSLIIFGYNVKIEATMPSNITNNTYSNSGIMYGIKTSKEEKEWFDELDSLDLKIDKLTMVSYPPHGLAYLYLQSEVVAPTCLSTPGYDQQWIDYFEYFRIDETNIYVDKKMGIENLCDSHDFGRYLVDNYNFVCEYDGINFGIYRIKRNK